MFYVCWEMRDLWRGQWPAGDGQKQIPSRLCTVSPRVSPPPPCPLPLTIEFPPCGEAAMDSGSIWLRSPHLSGAPLSSPVK